MNLSNMFMARSRSPMGVSPSPIPRSPMSVSPSVSPSPRPRSPRYSPNQSQPPFTPPNSPLPSQDQLNPLSYDVQETTDSIFEHWANKIKSEPGLNSIPLSRSSSRTSILSVENNSPIGSLSSSIFNSSSSSSIRFDRFDRFDSFDIPPITPSIPPAPSTAPSIPPIQCQQVDPIIQGQQEPTPPIPPIPPIPPKPIQLPPIPANKPYHRPIQQGQFPVTVAQRISRKVEQRIRRTNRKNVKEKQRRKRISEAFGALNESLGERKVLTLKRGSTKWEILNNAKTCILSRNETNATLRAEVKSLETKLKRVEELKTQELKTQETETLKANNQRWGKIYTTSQSEMLKLQREVEQFRLIGS